jgi:hypothetical protein
MIEAMHMLVFCMAHEALSEIIEGRERKLAGKGHDGSKQ